MRILYHFYHYIIGHNFNSAASHGWNDEPYDSKQYKLAVSYNFYYSLYCDLVIAALDNEEETYFGIQEEINKYDNDFNISDDF